jgi:hypothetical protein
VADNSNALGWIIRVRFPETTMINDSNDCLNAIVTALTRTRTEIDHLQKGGNEMIFNLPGKLYGLA